MRLVLTSATRVNALKPPEEMVVGIMIFSSGNSLTHTSLAHTITPIHTSTHHTPPNQTATPIDVLAGAQRHRP